jgi:hypothetical protein
VSRIPPASTITEPPPLDPGAFWAGRIIPKLAILAILALFGASGGQEQIDDSRHCAIKFDVHWNVYVRRLFGCPLLGETTAATCSLARGTVDYVAYRKAREQAKILFQLGERR